MADSLIPEPHPSLPGFSSADIPDEDLAPEARNPEFTAARFFKSRPEAYKMICTLLGEGVSHAAIARALSVSRNTVASIYAREHSSLPVEQARVKACQEYGQLAGLCRDRAREMLLSPDTSFTPQGLGVLMGVAQDKAIALSGGGPVHIDIHVDREDITDLISRAREKMSFGSQTRSAKGDPVDGAIEVEADVAELAGGEDTAGSAGAGDEVEEQRQKEV